MELKGIGIVTFLAKVGALCIAAVVLGTCLWIFGHLVYSVYRWLT